MYMFYGRLVLTLMYIYLCMYVYSSNVTGANCHRPQRKKNELDRERERESNRTQRILFKIIIRSFLSLLFSPRSSLIHRGYDEK